MPISRRSLFGALVAAGAAVAGQKVGSKRTAKVPIRPPGAVPEGEFQARCIRCFQCGEVCPTHAIRFRGFDEGLAEAMTPEIKPREQGCIACMKCTQICPTGALQSVEAEDPVILTTVNMGVARLNEDMCYSWVEPARTCGVCYRACPFPGVAMSIEVWERPVVHADQCIGCGLCEQACIHLPQAIRVLPTKRDA